jgi:hypothetical protein
MEFGLKYRFFLTGALEAKVGVFSNSCREAEAAPRRQL